MQRLLEEFGRTCERVYDTERDGFSPELALERIEPLLERDKSPVWICLRIASQDVSEMARGLGFQVNEAEPHFIVFRLRGAVPLERAVLGRAVPEKEYSVLRFKAFRLTDAKSRSISSLRVKRSALEARQRVICPYCAKALVHPVRDAWVDYRSGLLCVGVASELFDKSTPKPRCVLSSMLNVCVLNDRVELELDYKWPNKRQQKSEYRQFKVCVQHMAIYTLLSD